MNEEFLSLFGNIESYIRFSQNDRLEQNFSTLIRNSNNPLVVRYQTELLELAKIRNILSHNNNIEHVLVKKEYLDLAIRVSTSFNKSRSAEDIMIREIKTFQIDDSLSRPLELIKELKINQFPILEDGRFKSLLTDNGITNWIANNIKMDIISIQETSIEDVITLEESIETCCFVSRDASISIVYNLFSTKMNLKALLVTENGLPNQKILGIITMWDLQYKI